MKSCKHAIFVLRDFSPVSSLTEEETKAQKGQMTCPRSHSKLVLLEIRT